MTFDEYQNKTQETAIYPNVGTNFIYPTLGLCGEAGEVAEKIKKVIRDGNGTFTVEGLAELQKEMGDVLWYVSQLASELRIPLGRIAEENIKKLQSRKDREVLQGSGDNR